MTEAGRHIRRVGGILAVVAVGVAAEAFAASQSIRLQSRVPSFCRYEGAPQVTGGASVSGTARAATLHLARAQNVSFTVAAVCNGPSTLQVVARGAGSLREALVDERAGTAPSYAVTARWAGQSATFPGVDGTGRNIDVGTAARGVLSVDVVFTAGTAATTALSQRVEIALAPGGAGGRQ